MHNNIIRAGLFRGRTHPSGGPSYDKWFSNGQSDINHFFGADAEELYLPGEPASGTITGKIAANVLTPVTTPTYQQALTGLADDPLGVGFHEATYDSFDASGSGVHDYTTGPFAMLIAFNIVNVPSQITALGGKRGGANIRGYELQVWRGSKYGVAFDPGGTAIRADVNVNPAPGAHYMFAWRQGTEVGCKLEVGETTNTVLVTSNLTTTALFALGSLYLPTPDSVAGPTIIWSGANAETVIANRATTLNAWWTT